MAVRTRVSAEARTTATAHLALAVADANWFSTANLFSEVERHDVSTLLLSCIDYRNAWQRGLPPWAWGKALRPSGTRQWRREHVLPSGWMKSYPRIGMRPLSRTILGWQRRHVPDAALGLVMTYPYYLHLAEMVRPTRTVYYNLDDYALYWPHCAEAVNAMERKAVREADLTVCVAKVRAEVLRAAVPEAANRIKHLPHGAPARSIGERPWNRPAPSPDDISHLPRPLIGYVGSIEDRVDWELMNRLATAFPNASIVIVGKVPAKSVQRDGWQIDWGEFASLPNVHTIGWRAQEEIDRYNRAFDVVLIPYRLDHPFNQVCSPTKIMDVMGTGRPVVSTAVPECTLYEDLFSVAPSPEAFVEAVGSILEAGSVDGRADLRFDWARGHTCAKVVDRLVDWIKG